MQLQIISAVLLNPITPRAVSDFPRGISSPRLRRAREGERLSAAGRAGATSCLPPAVFRHRSHGESWDSDGGEADNSSSFFHHLRTSGLTAGKGNKIKKNLRRHFATFWHFEMRRGKPVASWPRLSRLDFGRLWVQANTGITERLMLVLNNLKIVLFPLEDIGCYPLIH